MADLNAAFWKWFGKSTVRNEDGSPKVVYHASMNDFSSFNCHSIKELGCHFGTRNQVYNLLKPTANVFEVFLSIQNPIRLIDRGDWTWEEVGIQLYMIDHASDPEGSEQSHWWHDMRRSGMTATQKAKFVKDKLIEFGYDGVVYLNRHEGTGYHIRDITPSVCLRGGAPYDRSHPYMLTDDEFLRVAPASEDSYIALSPEQIKSIDNDGTWDRDDPNIRSNPQVPSVVYHGTSAYAWGQAEGGIPLYVAVDFEEAKKYAYERAAADEYDGIEPQPIVVRIPFKDIASLELIPDNPTSEPRTWRGTLAEYGSFAVVGITEEMKRRWRFGSAKDDDLNIGSNPPRRPKVYFYHVTKAENLPSIAASGLIPSHHDFANKEVIFIEEGEEESEQWLEDPDEGASEFGMVMLRFKLDPKRVSTIEETDGLVWRWPVPPSEIEVRSDSGWEPIASSNPPACGLWGIHSTFKKHLPSIAKHGLQPLVSHMFPEYGPVIFFCEMGDGECMETYREGTDPEEWVLLRFPWPKAYRDLGSEFITKEAIPPSELQIFTLSAQWKGWEMTEDDKYWRPVAATNPPLAYHQTHPNAIPEIMQRGFQPSRSGYYGPGLYAYLAPPEGGNAVAFDYGHLRLWDEKKPVEMTQRQWDRMRGGSFTKLGKALAEMGYDGVLFMSHGWILVFPSSVGKITPTGEVM